MTKYIMSKRGNKTGSIFKVIRDGKTIWICQVHLGYKDNGKPRYKQYQRKTQKEAEDKLLELQSQLRAGTFVDSSKIGFNDWVKEYLTNYNTDIRPTTAGHYESLARNHIYPAFANLRLQEVKTNFIQRFISEKAQTLSPSSVQKLRIIVKAALQQAIREKLLNENPAVYTTAPKIEAQEVEPLTEDQLKALLDAARPHRLYYALMLILWTGMRRGELLGLKWEDVNFEYGTVRIVRNYVATRQGDAFQKPKTKSSRRVVNIPDEITKLLQEVKAKSNPENPWVVPVEKQVKNTEYLPVAPRNFSRTYELWCKKAGIQNVKIHTLRHTYASFALAQNVHMKIVQAQLGHRDITTTINTYSHFSSGLQQAAAVKMNEKLLSIISDEKEKAPMVEIPIEEKILEIPEITLLH